MSERSRDSLLWIDAISSEDKEMIDKALEIAISNAPKVKMNREKTAIIEDIDDTRNILDNPDNTKVILRKEPKENEYYLDKGNLTLMPYLFSEASRKANVLRSGSALIKNIQNCLIDFYYFVFSKQQNQLTEQRIEHESRHIEEALETKGIESFRIGVRFVRDDKTGLIFWAPVVIAIGECTVKEFKRMLLAPGYPSPPDLQALE